MNLGMSFSGYWWGPYTLLPRVMISGRLNDLWGRRRHRQRRVEMSGTVEEREETEKA
jgi:hypothetical protein